MEEASNNLEFEKAIEYRNLKLAIEETISKQKISINDLTSRDYIGIYYDNDEISINIIITRNGNVVQNHQTIINKIGDFEDETINYLKDKCNLKRVKILSQDGPTEYIKKVINKMDEETFKKWNKEHKELLKNYPDTFEIRHKVYIASYKF